MCIRDSGLNEAEDEELERVDLADEDSEADKNCGCTQTSLKHS